MLRELCSKACEALELKKVHSLVCVCVMVKINWVTLRLVRILMILFSNTRKRQHLFDQKQENLKCSM